MLLKILDGLGIQQNILAQSQEAIVDHSSTLASVAAQNALAANVNRSGWFFQNISVHDMWISETGVAVVGVAGSIKVPAGASISSYNYPVFTAALSVIGTSTDAFTCREW